MKCTIPTATPLTRRLSAVHFSKDMAGAVAGRPIAVRCRRADARQLKRQDEIGTITDYFITDLLETQQ
jgi:hypothetical protein